MQGNRHLLFVVFYPSLTPCCACLPQACYEAAQALNVKGGGVQVRRNKCFEQACRALWPGDEAINEDIVTGFSSENVEPFSDGEEANDEANNEANEEANDEGSA